MVVKFGEQQFHKYVHEWPGYTLKEITVRFRMVVNYSVILWDKIKLFILAITSLLMIQKLYSYTATIVEIESTTVKLTILVKIQRLLEVN